MRMFLWAALLAATAAPAIPATARADNTEYAAKERDRGHEGRHDNRGDHKRWEKRAYRGQAYRIRRERAEIRRNNRAYYRQTQRQYARQRRYRQQDLRYWQTYNRYDYNRPDPRYGTYYAERYYRDSRYYQPRVLSRDDRIYRGSNGRYYCRRNDGTTGLIIGALGGGFLGDAIAPRGSQTLGAILGGTAGALIGQSIGQDGVRCQ